MVQVRIRIRARVWAKLIVASCWPESPSHVSLSAPLHGEDCNSSRCRLDRHEGQG